MLEALLLKSEFVRNIKVSYHDTDDIYNLHLCCQCTNPDCQKVVTAKGGKKPQLEAKPPVQRGDMAAEVKPKSNQPSISLVRLYMTGGPSGGWKLVMQLHGFNQLLKRSEPRYNISGGRY